MSRRPKAPRPLQRNGATGRPRVGRPPSGSSINILRSRGFYSAFGYQSATVPSYEGRSSPAGSGASHQLHHRTLLVNQARDFARNNGLFQGMIDRAVSYVVGTGFNLQAKTGSRRWNGQAERAWKEFWRFPEIRGLTDGPGLEALICSELMIAGDVGVLKTNRKKLQVIESEQIVGKSPWNEGIETDTAGVPVRYHLAKWGNSGRPVVGSARPVSPDEFLFLVRLDRASALRGVPPLQASFPMLHRIGDVCDSEAAAWQLLSRIAIAINKANAGLEAFNTSKDDPSLASEDEDGRASTRVTDLDTALIFHAEPGEEIKGIERNIPGQNFSQALTMFMRLLGLPLGLPLEIILLDWTKSNYSQSRAVLEQAYVTFLRWQKLLEAFFHRRVYEWFIDLAVADDTLQDRPDKYMHEWIMPTFPWIDQLAEATAHASKIDRSFCTHASVLRSLNKDRDEVIAQRDREIRSAIEVAKKITDDTGVAVPWQPFAGLQAPGAPGSPMPAEASREEPREPEPEPEEDEDDDEQ